VSAVNRSAGGKSPTWRLALAAPRRLDAKNTNGFVATAFFAMSSAVRPLTFNRYNWPIRMLLITIADQAFGRLMTAQRPERIPPRPHDISDPGAMLGQCNRQIISLLEVEP
jgi:hypothetical protein